MRKRLFIVGMLVFVYMLITSKDAYAANVSNQDEFIRALNGSDSTITISTSINFTKAITVKRSVTINAGSNENAIRWQGSGSFITINNGGNLTIGNIVVDVRSYKSSAGISCIDIKNGGILNTSGFLLDGGTSNVGVLIESGGSFNMGRGNIVYCNKGIRCTGSGKLTFTSTSETAFWNNTIAVSFEDWSGTCAFNKSNIKIRNNTHGILMNSGTGTVTISAGSYYSNSSVGVHCRAGTVNI